MSRRDYNGLSGDEILELAVLAFREALHREGRLAFSQVYHNVTIRGDFEIESYPHEPAVEKFPISIEAPVGSPVEKGKGKKSKVSFKQEHFTPDVARDAIEEAKAEDVSFITHAESRG